MLYIVPTPVGNLKDITLRGIDILKQVDLILAEDTRTSGKLLKQYEIETPMRSFHQHNEHRVLDSIVDELNSGTVIALISDAGTPSISDPGFLLVRACVEKKIEIQTLPGATAFVPALVNSGFPSDRFVFEGFLPQKKGRTSRLKELSEEKKTIVLYESPHRITRLMKELSEHLEGNRRIAAVREISKLHEETLRGTAMELNEYFRENPPRGEFVVVIEGYKKEKAS
ncbi:MAG: 16S rRNA (cytidine(1402)-2'-O)-methyltransferase [Flavobacteriales bacterium]|nr:16S rRNA (cytidine(1402)-2'-O)-methyltransferase [Flavobacteriales bacterium]NNK81053.1 16S rRNA (cytidine(1402)-2'-O)-methyltransferase [Flavobacteriales bacterium]